MADSLSLPISHPLSALTVQTHHDESPPSPSVSEQFLRFYLVPDTNALLPVEALTGVLKIPHGQVMPIFNMPAWVMGVYNWRGEILWMVDLGHLLGLTPWYRQATSASSHSIVVLQARSHQATSTKVKSQMLGLVVNRVEDINSCAPDLIQAPPLPSVTSELAPFLQGYWLKSKEEMLFILDDNAIFAAMSDLEISTNF